MSEWWTGWWQLKAMARYGALAAAAACLLMLSWLVWLRPELRALTAEQQRLKPLTTTLQLRQQQWRQNPPNALLQAQLISPAVRSASGASGTSGQAIEILLTSRRDQLEQWQPDTQPRTLTLHLQWQEFQPLFTELVQAAAPFPAHFLLLAQPEHLVAQLWLEPDDAP